MAKHLSMEDLVKKYQYLKSKPETNKTEQESSSKLINYNNK
jgi:hypothetical protein